MSRDLTRLGTPVVVVPGFPFPTEIRESVVGFQIGTTITTLLANNPNRVFFHVENLGGFQARVAFNRNVSTSYGRLLDSSGGWLSGQSSEDGDVVGWELFAIANGGATGVYVLEVNRIVALEDR